MLEDEQDKAAARSQLIGLVLVTLLVLVYFNYFLPKTQPQQPQQPAGQPVVEQPKEVSPEPSDLQLAEAPLAEAPTEQTSGWPNLPPVPEQSDPNEDEVSLQNDDLDLVFTRIGGRLKRAYVLLHDNGEDRIQLVPEEPDKSDMEAVYPFGLRFTDAHLLDELDRRRFDVVERTDISVTFGLTLPNAAEIRKTFKIDGTGHVIEATISYTCLESTPRVLGMDQTPAYIFNWGPNVASEDLTKRVQQYVVWRVNGANDSVATTKMKPAKDGKPFEERIDNPEWVGIRSAYFLVAFKPEYSPDLGWAVGTHERFRVGVAVPRTEIAPGETLTNAVSVYIGPSERRQLAAAWPTLETARRFFEYPEILNWFANALLNLMNWFYGIVPNYGLAIILVTLLVRGAMVPLTMKQMRSMKRMQLLAPEMEKLKEKYGEDPQELNKKMMEMYKERGVNPLGGCFPMLLQFPVFIALYRMLSSSYELRGAPFIFWINDLSQPDHLLYMPFMSKVPFIGPHVEFLNLLPILCAIAMIVSTKLMPMSGPAQNPQQKMMMTFMPVFFSVICYNFASGLNLYILVSTAVGIIQNRLIRVSETDIPEKKPPKKKQHWYAAAQARRRQAEKGMKESKDNGKHRDTKKKGHPKSKARRSK